MKKYLSDYIRNVLRNLGLFTLAMSVFVSLCGEKVKGITPLAALGSKGIPVRVLFQALLVNLIGVALARLFLSEAVIKDMKPSLRIILATGCAFLTVFAAIIGFGWIPLHEEGSIPGLCVFAVCFPCIFIYSAHRFIRREQAENQQLADALSKYKAEHTI